MKCLIQTTRAAVLISMVIACRALWASATQPKDKYPHLAGVHPPLVSTTSLSQRKGQIWLLCDTCVLMWILNNQAVMEEKRVVLCAAYLCHVWSLECVYIYIYYVLCACVDCPTVYMLYMYAVLLIHCCPTLTSWWIHNVSYHTCWRYYKTHPAWSRYI